MRIMEGNNFEAAIKWTTPPNNIRGHLLNSGKNSIIS